MPRVHVVGIGGAGMSAIATVLAAMGHTVTGSDLRGLGVTDRLRALGIDVAIGHDAANVGTPTWSRGRRPCGRTTPRWSRPGAGASRC